METRKKYKIMLSEKYVRKSENGKEWFQFPLNISGQLVAIQTIIPLDPYTEPDLDAVRKEAYDKGYTDAAYNCHERCAFLDDAKKEAYQRGYETAKYECEDCTKPVDNGKAYQMGLNDAWEAARKIGSNSMCSLKEMGFDFSQCAVSDYNPSWFVVKNYSASECIEKIRQYEQEQEEIKVGDEVVPRETEYDDMIVTRLWKDDYDSDCIDAIGFDGRIGSFLVSRVSKTGKHYEIAEVFEKMRGEQDGKRGEE